MTKLTLQQHFDREASKWERWREANLFLGDVDPSKFESVEKLVEMGDDIVPMIFSRWLEEKEAGPDAVQLPWWTVLERITGIRMVSDAERLAGVPPALRASISPAEITVIGLEEKRWLNWWETKGKAKYQH